MPRNPIDELSPEERRVALQMLEQLGDQDFLFAVVTGTHQYGFTSPDSDIDVRGAFRAPARAHLGLGRDRQQHVEYSGIVDGREADCLAFELGRFTELVLKHAGNVIEELYSPLVLLDGGRLQALREAVGRCLTRDVSRHYIGFFNACLKKLHKRQPPEVKTALYACRIALTGMTLLGEGRVEAHLPTLAEEHGLDWVDEWIALKTTEHEPIPEGRLEGMLERLQELSRQLRRAASRSLLPREPEGLEALDALIVDIRLEGIESRPEAGSRDP